MKQYKSSILILIFFSVFISGCWFVRIGIKNTTDAIFGEPEQVKNKIKDPIKDNVRLSALWVGHSTVLVQMDDKVFFVDPVFEDAIGGVMLRKVEAGLDLNDLPRLDLILASHAHMDHMSIRSIDDLDDKYPNAKLVFPYGAEEYLPSYSMDMIRLKTGNSEERGYVGETRIINGLKVTAVYALHQGGRYGFDSYLWNVPGCTGYIVEYNGMTVFYAGDTAYDEKAYKELGKKYKIDLALIPIGPCRDCETDGNFNHVASLGGLKMLDDLQAEYMLPIHYGAVEYFGDPDEPIIVLRSLIERHGSNTATGVSASKPYSEKVVILNEGEQHVFKYKE
jgi:L-ascorbate metabolism protein UlaG (beta-lactamase superfamily)